MDVTATKLSWHDSLWHDLRQRIEGGRLPHAVLLHGPPGVGKQALMRRLARRLLCLEPRDGEACGLCRSCRLSGPDGAHPDWIKVAPEAEKSVILVEQIRRLCAGLALSAAFDGHRVGSIEAADGMNVNAANALLKTLEEPGRDVMMILVAGRIGRLPATVRSRCQPLFCPAPPREQALTWLQQHSSAPSVTLETALQLAAGGPLLALEWLQQEVVDEARQVDQDLQQLAQAPRPDPLPVWQRWRDIPAQRLWYWVLLSLQQQLRRLAKNGGVAGAELQWLLNLSATAQRGLRLADTPVRDDLQMWHWLLQWIEAKPQ